MVRDPCVDVKWWLLRVLPGPHRNTADLDLSTVSFLKCLSQAGDRGTMASLIKT